MSTPQDDAVAKYQTMQAFAAGRYIESKSKESNNWQDDFFPSWNWEEYDYRVKAEEKWRAFKDSTEFPHGLVKVRSKLGSYWSLVVAVGNDHFLGISRSCIMKRTFKKAFEHGDEISLDGGKTWQPCGVKV